MKSFLSIWSLSLALLIVSDVVLAQPVDPAQTVATAVAVEGTAFVARSGGRKAILARGSSLRVGDAINTTRNSSVRVQFTDGGETVVRPESTLVVEKYQFRKEVPSEDNVLLQLLKGGIRSLTGAIGKRGNVDAYQLRANTATVGIRGTDFSVRLCQQDCNESGHASHSNSATPVAARAVQVQGAAQVSHEGSAMKALTVGQALYSGDVLQTQLNSYVMLVFSDNARITVNPFSQIAIAEYANVGQAADAANQGVSRMIIDMFKGGMRFATGLIGKTNPAKVKVRTATATVGIRGTVFDVVCAPGGSADSASASSLGDMPCSGSIFVQTREGAVTLGGTTGEPIVLPAGQSGRVSGPDLPARSLQVMPEYFQTIDTPEPEKYPANIEALFGSRVEPDASAGVFVTVHSGKILLAQADKDILLDAGESAFASPRAVPIRLQSVPPILDRDPFLSSGMFKANMCRR